MTFSIVAYDQEENAWGVAVASKFLAVAWVVSWAGAEAGAIATQAYGKMGFGPTGLAMLKEGSTAEETLAALLASDPGREQRQVGIVDKQGGVAAHTGARCSHWAGHLLGDGFACQGNILAGEGVLAAMAQAYTGATGELADRLVAALLAGDVAGGDRRGKQSAGVLVVKPNGSYSGDNDRYLDLRVDDDPEPVQRLAGLVNTHHLYFQVPRSDDRLPITPELARELQAMLVKGGYTENTPNGNWDEETIKAFSELVGTENVEVRWPADDPHGIDRQTLDYLRVQPHLRS